MAVTCNGQDASEAERSQEKCARLVNSLHKIRASVHPRSSISIVHHDVCFAAH